MQLKKAQKENELRRCLRHYRTKQFSFIVERQKEMQEWNEQKMPKTLSGYSGSRLPGSSTREKDREELEPDDDRKEKNE